jgi:hypothetical protein
MGVLDLSSLTHNGTNIALQTMSFTVNDIRTGPDLGSGAIRTPVSNRWRNNLDSKESFRCSFCVFAKSKIWN